MDAGPVIQENVSNVSNSSAIFRKLIHKSEYSQEDELASAEDDMQVGVANQHSGSSRFD